MPTLPAGEYYIGDPCYAIADDEWDLFLDAWDEELRDPDHGGRTGGVFEYKGHKVFAAYTAHGDGRFDGYAVDSGTLGAIPTELVHEKEREEILTHDLGTFKQFDEEFEADEDEGTFYIGDEVIQTDDLFDDDDDEYESPSYNRGQIWEDPDYND